MIFSHRPNNWNSSEGKKYETKVVENGSSYFFFIKSENEAVMAQKPWCWPILQINSFSKKKLILLYSSQTQLREERFVFLGPKGMGKTGPLSLPLCETT